MDKSENINRKLRDIENLENLHQLVFELEGLIDVALHRESIPEEIPSMIASKIEAVAAMAGYVREEMNHTEMAGAIAENKKDINPEEHAELSDNKVGEVDEDSVDSSGYIAEEEGGECLYLEEDEEVPMPRNIRRTGLAISLTLDDEPGADSEREIELDTLSEQESECEQKLESEAESEPESEPEPEPDEEPEEEPESDLKPERFASSPAAPVFSVNDRFLYTRELFNGNFKEFERALKEVASLDSYEEAEEFFYTGCGFDAENPVVADFMIIISKCFS